MPLQMRPFLLLVSALVGAEARHKKYYSHTAESGVRSTPPCDAVIPGPWTGYFPKPLGDLYDLTWDPATGPGAFVATCEEDCGWSVGKGQFGVNNGTATISFDTGVNLTGNVSSDCSVIDWSNDSTWKWQPPTPIITDVHIIAMNHLDVGYNGIPGLGLINNILTRYFQVYFPRAIQVAQSLRAHDGPERLIYTTHGFLMHLYLHCEPMNLSGIPLWCPPPADVQAMKDAIARGDIVWHAGAFNTEYENAYNEEMVNVQFQLSFDLADELGVPRPKTASLRDVPGTTRALVPILVRNGITALSVGVNNGSPAPAMPNPGVWFDPASGSSILYMQTQQGQGYPNNPGSDPANCGGMCASYCVTFTNLSHALCWAFRTDNSGPPMDADEVFRQFDIARWQFPGANVYASTYDNFTAQLETVRSQLPVTTGEAGDTWMTSTTADSWKMTFYREAARAYKICLDSAQCDIHDPRVLNFTRLLIKLPEHTWGLPGLDDSVNWTNDQFHAAIASNEQAYLDALHSYTEQRDIATVVGMGYLADHPLAANITARMNALVPSIPNTSSLTLVPPSGWTTPLSVTTPGGIVTLAFDGTTGALTTAVLAGVSWADATHPLGQYVYKTFNDTDYDAQGTCCYGEGGRQKIADPQRTTTNPTMTGLWVDSTTAPHTAVVSMTMPALQNTYYGAPATLWLTVVVNADASVSMDLQAFNKTATRLGEAHFMHFLPIPVAGDYVWMMDKIGTWINPLDTVANGGLHQHGVRNGVAYMSTSAPNTKFLAIDTLDATVVNPATAAEPASMFPQPLTPLTGPVLGFDVQLLQNAFSTNTPLFSWDTSYRWRFTLRASQ